MSRQKRLTKLTLAATIMVAASATSFAQTESTKSRTEATSDVAVAMNLPNAPKTIERVDNSNVPTTVAVTSVSTARPSFSATKFMAAVNQSVFDTSLTTAPRTNSELRFEPKFELNSEEFSAPTKTPRITFVPSRGQKLPTQ